MLLTPAEIKDGVMIALSALRANKVRSGLTVLGVMIGVSSVIILSSIVNGLDSAVEAEIAGLGSNAIAITKLPFDVEHSELSEEDRNRPPITVGEAQAILDNCPTVDGVSPQNYYFRPGGNEAKYRNRKANRPLIVGTWPDYARVSTSPVALGRFIDKRDIDSRAMVCVIGHNVAEGLFENLYPIDKEIRVNGNLFRVIGVFEEQTSSLDDDPSQNRLVAMPLSTYEKIHPWEKELFLLARARSYEEIDRAREEIIGALRVYRKVPFNKANNFAISTQDSIRDQFAKITDILYLAMMVVTSVGLLVGGIGVMNIMLVSVTERTREIGVRKAIGAKRSNIILQFLTEATTLSLAGGIIGIVFGLVVGPAINLMIGFPIGISVVWVMLGFAVSVSVGLISGIYPAYKAASLDPIEALRYE